MLDGRYVVRLIVRNGDGCADTAYAYAEAYVTPVAQYMAEPSIREEIVIGTLILLTSTAQGATRTSWSVPGYGSHEGLSWQVRFMEAGEYCFTLVVDRMGCADSVRGCIRVRDPYLYVPNAFTPNGDGVNDVFEVKVWGLKDGRMRVWDRWGVLVFDNGGDMTRHWDGTYQGKPVPEDAYAFVIEGKVPPHEKPYKRSGTVTVMR
jgi:gliding motility-associated-like protein